MALSNFYFERKSSYRKLSAPTKFILPLIFMTMCFIFDHPFWNFIPIIVVVFLLIYAKIPGQVVKSFISILYTLIPIISISWIIFYSNGTLLYTLGPVNIYSGGLIKAASMDFRFISLVMAVPLILGTMSQEEMVAGLRKMKLPYRICLIIAMTFRMIPTIEGDLGIIREAQMSRGVEFEKLSLIQKLKNFVSLIIPLFTVSISRIETLSRVIECRGVSYSKGRDKTFYKEPEVKFIDYFIIFAGLALLAAGIYLQARYNLFVMQ